MSCSNRHVLFIVHKLPVFELLRFQREETSAATTAHLSTLARAEAAEKALEVHAEEIAKVTDLEHTLASYQEKYKAEREAKRAFRRVGHSSLSGADILISRTELSRAASSIEHNI